MKKIFITLVTLAASASYANTVEVIGSCTFIDSKGVAVIDSDKCDMSGGPAYQGNAFIDVESGKNKINVIIMGNGQATVNGVAARYTDTKSAGLTILRTIDNEVLVVPSSLR